MTTIAAIPVTATIMAAVTTIPVAAVMMPDALLVVLVMLAPVAIGMTARVVMARRRMVVMTAHRARLVVVVMRHPVAVIIVIRERDTDGHAQQAAQQNVPGIGLRGAGGHHPRHQCGTQQ